MTLGSGTGHGGNIHLLRREVEDKGEILDFSANINPMGPPAWLRSCISREIEQLVHYPDPDCYEYITAISKHYAVASERIVAANGTTEILYHLPQILECKRAIIPVPSYIDYQKVMHLNGVEVVEFPLENNTSFVPDLEKLGEIIVEGDVVIIGTPNNPSAVLVEPGDIKRIAKKYPEVWFVIDEAFLDFLDDVPSVSNVDENIITLNSLTKFYALPGLRLGFGVFPTSLSKRANTFIPPWTVNSLAQKVGARALGDYTYKEKSISYLKERNRELRTLIGDFQDLKIYPSRVNYFLIEILNEIDVATVRDKMLDMNIAIRDCSNYAGLDEKFFRIAVRTKKENYQLIEALSKIFRRTKNRNSRIQKKKPSLMIQGTSSNAGKSVLVSAFCRILIQDGIRVAPFKAQNMSLNSYVTIDGLEMGRAQVAQAQSAKLDPDVRMNPVLLKPNSEMGSQVIVNGKPVGNMSVKEYVRYKDEAGLAAKRSYDSLSHEYDAVLLEGAGSPGEVNLKHHDIVNMRMAEYAESPVLLVGDIDRGGVYASFVGTMEVLEEWERHLIAGFLVNRFRGDSSLLEDAHSFVYNHTKRSVLGTIPYISDLGIPEEDSVSFKEGKLQRQRPDTDHVEIALINLPHISNFTDIEPFLDEPDVFLNIVNKSEELGNPDAIIIPGSKNVINDLQYLTASDLGNAIKKKSRDGIEIVGICGGYQILGEKIADPYCIESDSGKLKGLGLLKLQTILAKEKTLIRKEGSHTASNQPVFGYEIHHGISSGELNSVLRFNDNSECGASHPDMPVWGSYLHGIFDSDPFRRWFINNLKQKKGLEITSVISAPYNLERAFDNLADIVRSSVDMKVIYKLMGL